MYFFFNYTLYKRDLFFLFLMLLFTQHLSHNFFNAVPLFSGNATIHGRVFPFTQLLFFFFETRTVDEHSSYWR